ncbi:MAG: hypothetical protein IT328_04390 [Caldilineaceae bacterium]|nr:hypothetical protein [Caldilineaceae bacterium]
MRENSAQHQRGKDEAEDGNGDPSGKLALLPTRPTVSAWCDVEDIHAYPFSP